MRQRVLLNVKRVKQYPSECAIAASTVLTSFYDSAVEYEQVRSLVPIRNRSKGMWTSEQANLFNDLGFTKVTIVTADIEIVDYTWAKLNKEQIISKLKQLKSYCGRSRNIETKERVTDLIRWLKREGYDNNLKIDQNFGKWIRKYIDNGRPVCASVNWTTLYKMPKVNCHDEFVDIGGAPEFHAVVVRGYDDKGIFVVDSHTQYYKGRLRKYRNGYYKIPWDRFLLNAPFGDLILVG